MKMKMIVAFLLCLFCCIAKASPPVYHICNNDSSGAPPCVLGFISDYPGGVWSSSDTGVAVVDPGTGEVISTDTGTAIITYKLTNECGTYEFSYTLGVLPPPVISGAAAVCMGSAITLTATPPGGTWSSSDTAIATVGHTSGIVTGISSGSVVITYISPAGCLNTWTITVGAPFHISICEINPIATCDSIITYCSGLTLRATGTPGPGNASYSWTGSLSYVQTISGGGTIADFKLTAPPADGIHKYGLTAVYDGCRATDTVVIVRNSTCEPCSYFRPCDTTCEGCATLPYFKTIIAPELNAGNITNAGKYYFIAKDARLALWPDAGNVFFMGTGVELSVDSTIELDSLHFFSSEECPWDGISVKNESGITGQLKIAQNTLIEHARIGGVFIRAISGPRVLPSSGNIIQSDYATYNRNVRDISIDKFNDVMTFPFEITNSVFTSRDFHCYHREGGTLTGQYPYSWPAAAYLKAPVTSETGNDPGFNIDQFGGLLATNSSTGPMWGSSGIWLSQVGYVDSSPDPVHPTYYNMILGSPADSAATNMFDTLIAGVHAEQTNMDLHNNIFRRTQRGSANGSGVFTDATTTNRKNQVRLLSATPATNNRFYNCEHGVDCKNVYNFYSENALLAATNYLLPPTTVIRSEYGYYFENKNYESQTVTGNTIRNIRYGINASIINTSSCSNGQITFNQNNISALTSCSGTEYGVNGILIYDQKLCSSHASPSGRVVIDGNHISGYQAGIIAKSSTVPTSTTYSNLHTSIINNTVEIKDNAAQNIDQKFGINCQNLDAVNKVDYNHIFGDTLCVTYNTPAEALNNDPVHGSAHMTGFIGIYLENTSFFFSNFPTNVSCNYVHDVPIAFSFEKKNYLKWRGNIMMRSKYGVVLNYTAVTYNQGSPCDPIDNVWAENGTGATTGWPGWTGSGVYETFTIDEDPATTMPITSKWYVRHDPSGIDGTIPPYYFPTNNGTAGVTGFPGVAYTPGTSLIDAALGCGKLRAPLTCNSIGTPRDANFILSTAPGNDNIHSGDATGIHGHNAATSGQYTLMPNPSNGNIRITSKYPVPGMVNAKVINAVGVTVLNSKLYFTQQQAEILLENALPGIYTVELTDAAGSRTTLRMVVDN